MDGLGEVHPEPVASRVRQRIHEAVDERSLGRHQLRVLAAARVNRERLAAKRD